MIQREERRLQRAFRRILAVAMVAPLAPFAIEACSSSKSTPADAEGGDASDADASTGNDGTTAPPTDGHAPQSCAVSYLDASGPDADKCGLVALSPCGLPPGVQLGGDSNCTIALQDCAYFCGAFYFACHAVNFVDQDQHVYDSCDDGSVPAGPITIDCVTCPGAAGRRPGGLDAPSFERAGSMVGDYFARVAHLEEASIRAFRDLRSELVERAAPTALVREASRAARDEVRHTRAMRRLARRFDGAFVSARSKRRERRPLEAMALENAVEGCVRETYGALLATWQAAHARDPETRRELARIAEDETRHAALAWAVARWAEARLDGAARARVAAGRAAAVRELAREIRPVPSVVAELVGLPSAALQRGMVAAFARQVAL
jgi:hypothetical protein